MRLTPVTPIHGAHDNAMAPMTQTQNTTVTAAVHQYLQVRAQRGELQPITLQSVRPLLQRFAAAVGPERPMGSVGRREALAWWDGLVCSPGSARVALGSVRSFLNWCVDQDLVRTNPLRGVRAPKEPRRVPVTLQPDEVGVLLSRLPDARAVALVAIMVQCGLRCIEVSRLRMEHLDRRQRTILVTGKGGHQRVLPVPVEAWDALQAYLRAYPAPGTGPMFRLYTDPTAAIDAGTLSNYVSRWMRAAGVKGRTLDGISAHALRRTMASDLLDGGANLRQVQDALGHAHLATTEVYLRRTTGQDLRDVMEGRRYRAA